MPPQSSEVAETTSAALSRWPLPRASGGKHERGTCLVIAGSAMTPGAALLSAVAALRSEVGKVQVASVTSVAAALGVAIPEALVVGLPEAPGGDIHPDAAAVLADRIREASVVLVGPGCMDSGLAAELAVRTAASMTDGVLVIDALPLEGLSSRARDLSHLRDRMIFTPNVKEAAGLAGLEPDEVGDDDLQALAGDLADRFGAVTAVKGELTWIATPDGRRWCSAPAGPGLSVAGSGDVLAGIVCGLAGRVDDPVQAAVFGVHAHAEAADRVGRRRRGLGYLARELLEEIPSVLAEVSE